MAALQFVDVPNYSALLCRATYANLSKNGGIMDRLNSWLRDVPGCKKANGGRKWIFDCGNGQTSSIEFGYLQNPGDEENYLSAEYQFFAVDEVTEVREEQYLALFGRVRRTLCDKHGPDYYSDCPDCIRSSELSKVPLRVRAASNPGGKRMDGDGVYYGAWVKDRFVPKEYLQANLEEQFNNIWRVQDECSDCEGKGYTLSLDGETKEDCIYCYATGYRDRVFLPARAIDNPSLDVIEYRRNLANMTPFDRARMEHGSWDIPIAGNIFFGDWFKYYRHYGEHIHAHSNGKVEIHGSQHLVNFITADTASKEKTESDYTVICAWAYNVLTHDLFLLDMFREKIIIPKITPKIMDMYSRYNAVCAVIEDKASGIGIIQELYTSKMSIIPYNPGDRDKVSRASEASPYYQAGKVYHPGLTYSDRPEWLSNYESELAGFNGMPHDDCVDNAVMAIHYVKIHTGGEILAPDTHTTADQTYGTFGKSDVAH